MSSLPRQFVRAPDEPIFRYRIDSWRWWKPCHACDLIFEKTGQNPAEYLGPWRCPSCETVDAPDD